MKFGLGSYSYHHCFSLAGQPGLPQKFDIFDIFGLAAGLGLSSVYIDAGHVGSLEASHLSKVREAAKARGLSLELGFMGTDLETLRPWLEAAAALGSPVLRTFVSRSRYVPPIREQIDAAVTNLRRTMRFADEVAVKIALENHMELTSEELLQIAARVGNPNLGFCFDTGNSLAVLEDPLKAAKNLAPLVLMVHLKDATITLTADTAVMHGVPLGEGIVPLKEITEVLREHAPEASLQLESLVQAQLTPKETWECEQAAVNKSVRYAREVLGL
ncbi:MAG: sugar phosphate isomerase/epimerase family protein [bacterium]